MTHAVNPHSAPDRAPDAADKTGQPNDNGTAATSQKLLDDLQGKFYTGAKPESVQKLVADGILPAGSTVIDFNEVRNHLASDKNALDKVNATQPTDTTAATKDVSDAQSAAGNSKKAVDDAQAAVDPVQKKIDDRNAQDKNTQADFATVSGALKKDRVYKEDLTKLAGDESQPQDVRDAAAHLLGTYHDARQQAGRASITVSKSDYGDTSWTGYPYFDKASIDAGIEKHQGQNQADQKTLEPLVAARDAAKATNDTANQDLAAKQKSLDDLNKGNKDLTDQKTALGARVAEEQAALTPSGDADKLGRVVKGGGYYQVAENLLGISDRGRHTTAQERELKMLQRLLQGEAREENGGKLPSVLKQNDQLLKPENLEKVIARLKESTKPAQAPSA